MILIETYRTGLLEEVLLSHGVDFEKRPVIYQLPSDLPIEIIEELQCINFILIDHPEAQ